MRALAVLLFVSACAATTPEPIPDPPAPPPEPAPVVVAPKKPAVSPTERAAFDYAVSPEATAAGMAIYRYLLQHK